MDTVLNGEVNGKYDQERIKYMAIIRIYLFFLYASAVSVFYLQIFAVMSILILLYGSYRTDF